jgi:hypothetical protein
MPQVQELGDQGLRETWTTHHQTRFNDRPPPRKTRPGAWPGTHLEWASGAWMISRSGHSPANMPLVQLVLCQRHACSIEISV